METQKKYHTWWLLLVVLYSVSKSEICSDCAVLPVQVKGCPQTRVLDCEDFMERKNNATLITLPPVQSESLQGEGVSLKSRRRPISMLHPVGSVTSGLGWNLLLIAGYVQQYKSCCYFALMAAPKWVPCIIHASSHLLVSNTIKMLIEETNTRINGCFRGATLNLCASEQSTTGQAGQISSVQRVHPNPNPNYCRGLISMVLTFHRRHVLISAVFLLTSSVIDPIACSYFVGVTRFYCLVDRAQSSVWSEIKRECSLCWPNGSNMGLMTSCDGVINPSDDFLVAARSAFIRLKIIIKERKFQWTRLL